MEEPARRSGKTKPKAPFRPSRLIFWKAFADNVYRGPAFPLIKGRPLKGLSGGGQGLASFFPLFLKGAEGGEGIQNPLFWRS